MPDPAATAPAADIRAVLRQVADAAGDWFDALPERPVRPGRDARGACGSPTCSRTGRSAVADVVADLVARRRAGPHRDGLAAVLRVRDRRRAPGRARRRLARERLGPERGPCGAVARRGGDRERRRRWMLDLLGAARGRVVRVRHRLPDGARHRARRRPPPRPGRRRPGRRARRPRRARRRSACSRARSGTTRSTARCGSLGLGHRVAAVPCRARRRGRDAPRRAPRRAARRATAARPSSPPRWGT